MTETLLGNVIDDVREFLIRSKLSTYCINAFLSLQNSSNLTAKELSRSSGVPIGRIYEVLDELENKRMIQISDSRPKTYRAIPLNRAIYNLILHQTKEDERRSTYLYEQAKVLESKLYSSDIKLKVEPSEIFYSTILEPKKIRAMFLNTVNEAREELLLNGFINQYSMKLFSMADKLVESILAALDRGVQIKSLMSFEYDNRPISDTEEKEIRERIQGIKESFNDLGISLDKDDYELRFTYKKFPNCYDVVDRERVIMKLQHPSASWQIFACLNIVDPLLAEELRKKYLNVWQFDTIS
ncbi:MAG: TrmB family transcriptional regulator [Candidatus Hodarchaeales archaeon]